MPSFVLVSQQRSGTGALTSFLSQAPKIINLSEILHPHDIDQPDNFFRYWLANDPAKMMRERINPRDLFIKYLQDIEQKYDDRHILLDIKANSLRHVLTYWEDPSGYMNSRLPQALLALKRRGYRILYLRRHDHFARYVSSKLAERSGVYHSNNASGPARLSLTINPAELRHYLTNAHGNDELLLDWTAQFDRSLVLNYAQCFENNKLGPDARSQLSQFFGLNFNPESEPSHVKQARPGYREFIENYNEVQDVVESVKAAFMK